jgi:hypothetical protein
VGNPIESHRPVDEPRVEVHVRVQLPRHEVVIFERDPFQLERDLEVGVHPRDLEHLVRTAVVEQFCSWSAWRMKRTSSARTSVGCASNRPWLIRVTIDSMFSVYERSLSG